jgi:hypothetical protein
MKNNVPSKNLVTGKTTSKLDYISYQFFLDPGLYPRF